MKLKNSLLLIIFAFLIFVLAISSIPFVNAFVCYGEGCERRCCVCCDPGSYAGTFSQSGPCCCSDWPYGEDCGGDDDDEPQPPSPPPTPSPQEICDGIDNDHDGLIDEGFLPDECRPVCQVNGYHWTANGGSLNCCGDDTDIRLKIDFTQIANTGNGNMHSYIYVGSSATRYNENQWIHLTQNGVPIVDSGVVKDVPGLALQRGNGWVYISLWGWHNDGSWEKAYGDVIFDKGFVKSFENYYGPSGKEKVDSQGDGIWSNDVGQDEVVYIRGLKTSSFYLTVTPYSDSYKLYYDGYGLENNPYEHNEASCDGRDNDCDGLIDEDLTRQCGPSTDVGECKFGTETCSNGNWENCIGAVYPTQEICDSKDNDCDGLVDEDYVCGICQRDSQWGEGHEFKCADDNTYYQCAEDRMSYVHINICKAYCSAAIACDGKAPNTMLNKCSEYGQTYLQDYCNNTCMLADDNCESSFFDCTADSECDEQLPETDLCSMHCKKMQCIPGTQESCGHNNIGECKLGTRVCMENGVWGTCIGAVYPTQEICDGKDNDCDGMVDEDCNCIHGQQMICGPDNENGKCKFGISTCFNGEWGPCIDAIYPTQEICDSKDNDCDSLVDEDFDLMNDNMNCGTCGNVCGEFEACVNGACIWQDPCIQACINLGYLGGYCNGNSCNLGYHFIGAISGCDSCCCQISCTDVDKDGYNAEGGECGPKDNCPNNYNPNQSDTDKDGYGDVCDVCPNDPLNDKDKDGVCGDVDNCPDDYNPDQLDLDGDGKGLVCDEHEECDFNFVKYPRIKIHLDSISFVNDEFVKRGDELRVLVSIKNGDICDMMNLKLKASIPELGIRSLRRGPIKIEDDETVSTTLILEIPYNARPGVYDLRLEAYNEGLRRIKHRQIIVY